MLRRIAGDERARFLAVGAFNTVLGYGLFVVFEGLLDGDYSYLLSLYLSYAIAIVVAFWLHRRVTFRVTGREGVVRSFVRFVGVYIVTLAINTVALPVLVEWVGLNPLLAQAIVVVATTIISYLGHKFFSFRRRPEKPTAAPAENTP
jgi:putative flippase GtrA